MVRSEGVDPVTGERVTIATYVRNGRIVRQRLAPHLADPDRASADQLDARADFAEAAATAYGRKATRFPPAAQAVRATLSGTGRPRRRYDRDLLQERLRNSLPAWASDRDEQLALLKAHMAVNSFHPPPVEGPLSREPSQIRREDEDDHPLGALLKRPPRGGDSDPHPMVALLTPRPRKRERTNLTPSGRGQ